MSWYRVGTAAITAGQTTVTGTGTNFSANGRVGDAFLGPDGRWYEVTNIASGTVLSILPAYQGATVSGGTYALAPMQGYNKTLTDAVNGMVNQWGSTLAGLGSVSTENVVPVAKGGTGGNTPALARSGLGLKAAAMADIVGTVSQSGGAPTGAIVERGSNANGEYVKFADGTLICWTSPSAASADMTTTVATGGGYQSSGLTTVTFPAPFVGIPAVVPCGRYVTGARGWVTINSIAQSIFNCIAHAFTNVATIQMTYIATGRWY